MTPLDFRVGILIDIISDDKINLIMGTYKADCLLRHLWVPLRVLICLDFFLIILRLKSFKLKRYYVLKKKTNGVA